MITERQMMIVDAVNWLGANEVGLRGILGLTHVAKATKFNVIHDEDSYDLVAQFKDKKSQYLVCAIEEYNQCIEEMKYHYDIPKWCSYNRADKELLTVENSDYSFYEKEKFVYGQDIYLKSKKHQDKQFKFGCYTLDGEGVLLLLDSGYAYSSVDNISSKPIKSKEDIELEEAKRNQLKALIKKHSSKFCRPEQFESVINEMQESGELAPVKQIEEE